VGRRTRRDPVTYPDYLHRCVGCMDRKVTPPGINTAAGVAIHNTAGRRSAAADFLFCRNRGEYGTGQARTHLSYGLKQSHGLVPFTMLDATIFDQ
jgi:hypothetical protein